jgi:hypothetical protein
MITPRLFYFHASTLHSYLFLLLACWEPRAIPSEFCCILIIVVMAPVIHIEMNKFQALLSHDDAIDDLKGHGWDVFLKQFEGYNLQVEKAFAQTFDGFRAKNGDMQLELTKDFVRKETGLPSKGKRWFKNPRIEEFPWSLFMTSRKITCCIKGIPITLLKPR